MPFPDFPGLSPSPLAPGQVSAFLQLSRRSRGCHRSARSRDNLASFLPISLVRLRHFLKCFRSYWALASGSRHADGLALKLTPRSLNIAFSDAPAGRVRSRRGCCINILGGKVGFRSSLFVHLSLLRLLRSTIDGVHISSKVDKH